MPGKSEARADEARASRNSCGGWFRDASNLTIIQSQFLIAAHHIRPEMAVMLGAVILGGGAHG